MEAVFLFGLFILLLMLSVPIGYAIGMVTLVTMLHFTSMPTLMIAQNSIAGVDSFPLLAIPFFMLAGNLMSGGGIAKRLVNFFECFIGHITGGLGMVTIIVCMFFAAISGSAVATVSAVGAFMIPQMVEHGYSKPFSAALTAAAGTIGVIIPPSVPFVIYGVVSGASITSLFTAGFLPGILMGVALMIVCFIVSKKRGYRGSTEPPSASVIWVTFKDAIWAILSPVIILGGIYSGKFTPTEAAVISVVYSYVVGRFVYKELDGSSTYKALKDAIVINGATTFMVGLSTAFAALLTMEQIPMKIAGFITSISQNGFVILLLINLLLLLVGMFIDNIPATIILTPILLPICRKFGMSPITFGIMLTMNLAIGFCTPPYGINLFVATAISKVKMEALSKELILLIGGLVVQALIINTKWNKCIDRPTMSRIQGLALEFLVAGAISSVKITVIVKYALPLIIQQGLFMIIMPFLLFFFGRRLFTHNWFENSIIVFGTACGVVATGFLLLRLIDPELKTESAEAFAASRPFCSPFIAGGILTSMMPNLIAQYGNLTVGLAWTVAFVCILIIAKLAGWFKLNPEV